MFVNFWQQLLKVFDYGGKLYNCSSNLMILKNNLILSYTLDSVDHGAPLVSGYTYNEILKEYLSKLHTFNKRNKALSVSPSIWATIAYDAVWALALAMNMSTVTNCTSLTSVANTVTVSRGTVKFTDKISQNLKQIEFTGASGSINFDSSSGYMHRTVNIIHINNSGHTLIVGIIDRESIAILTDSPQIFINNTIIAFVSIHPSVAAIFLVIILTLFAATLLLHILSTVKQKQPSIKASSPLLNHFIFFGCYIWTATSIIYILLVKTLNFGDDCTYAKSCHAIWVWLIPIGMTLTVGTLFARTWRIYKIFIHFQNPGRLISNQALIALVLIQLGIDVVLGTTWSVISPMQVENIDGDVHVKENNITVTQSRERTCVFSSKGISYVFWLTILYCYKVVQILSLFAFTLLTRNVNNKRFTTVLLRKASYLTFVLYVLLLPIFTVLWKINAKINEDVIVMCVLISATMSVCLLLVLLPPAIPVLKKIFLR